jgi:DNA-binding GntR family transcriptional regulator
MSLLINRKHMSNKPRNEMLGQFKTIDRNSYVPAYMQLVNSLRGSVTEGLLHPGDQLPSEPQLCKHYEVSPMTVRRAINILIDQGVVTAEQGRGTFVKPAVMSGATFQLGQLQNLFSAGTHSTINVLETRILAADEKSARKLKVKTGRRIIYIRRLLRNEGVPTYYHREFLIYDPSLPIVEAELEVTALHQLFNGSSESLLKRGDITIEATILDAEESRLLEAPQPMAAFRIEHIFYEFDNKPVSWGWFIGRADHLRFYTHVGL